MKTTLRDQRQIIELIQQKTLTEGIKALRQWLQIHGYEEITECEHFTINRISGKCISCGKQYCEPIIAG